MAEGGASISWGDEEAALATVNAQIDHAQKFAVEAQRVQQEIAAVVGRARSRDGLVTVTVSVSGQLTDLHISEDASEGSMAELAKTIRTTMAGAQARAGEQAVQLMGDAFGEDAPATARLRSELEQRAAPPEGRGLKY